MAIDAGSIYSKLELKAGGYEAALRKAERQADGFLSNFEKRNKTANKMIAGLTVPIGLVGVKALKTGSEFEAGMSKVGAISQASEKELQLLEKTAREMGRTTKFSATESAEALTYMAMAGWDTNQMVSGLPGVMNLAAASGENLGTVSDIVTDALSAFGMEASQSTEFADLLASAASNSNTNVGMMGETFKYVAPIAGALGYSAEDTALAIGLMANAGIKGSQAGTTLRSVMTRMVKPTKESAQAMDDLGITMTEADGTMKPFNKVLVESREAFAKLSEEQKVQYASAIAGQQGMSGFLAIMNATEEEFEQLTEATTDYNGAAERMAEIMEDNLQGDLTRLKSALEGVAIDGFKIIVPLAADLVEAFQRLVDWTANLSDGQKELGIKFGLALAGAGPLLKGVNLLTKGFGTATESSGALGGGLLNLATGFSPVKAGLVAVGGLAMATAWQMSKDALPEVEIFGEGISETTAEALEAFKNLSDGAETNLQYLASSSDIVTKEMSENMTTTYNAMGTQIIEELELMKKNSSDTLDNLYKDNKEMTKEELEEIKNIATEAMEGNIQRTKELQDRATEIYETARKEKRTITEAEAAELQEINELMKEQAIETLSESELEQKVIMQRLKDNSVELSVEKAQEVVKQSIEQRDKTIQQAEDEYNEQIKIAEKLKNEGTKKAKKAAENIIKEAKKQRDKTVEHAEKMHSDVVKEAQAQAEEHVDKVDWETGETLSKWETWKTKVGDTWSSVVTNFKKKTEENKTDASAWGRDVNTITDDMAENTASSFTKLWREASSKSKSTKDDTTRAFRDTQSQTKRSMDTMASNTSRNFDKVKDAANKGVEGIRLWNRAQPKDKKATFITRIKEIFSSSGKKNRNLGGPMLKGGYTWVGEQGRELVKLPPGSRVMSNQKSESMSGIDYDKLGKAVAKAIDDANITVDTYLDSKKVSDSTSVHYNRRLRHI